MISIFIRIKKIILISLFLISIGYETAGSAPVIQDGISESEKTIYLAAVKKKKYHRIVKKQKPRTPYPEIRTDFISVGGGYFQYDWQAGTFEASDKGKYGIAHAGIQFKVSYLLLGFSADYTKLVSDYSGKIPTGQFVEGELNTIHADMKYKMGFSYSFSERLHLVFPYTGLQYHYWKKEGVPSDFKTDERYEWFQLPVGIHLQIQLFRGFVIGFDLSGGVTLGGMATIFTAKNTDFLNEKVPENEYPIFQMENGWFYRGEMPWEFYISKRFGLQLSPWYEKVKLGNRDSFVINEYQTISLSEIEMISYGINLLIKIYL